MVEIWKELFDLQVDAEFSIWWTIHLSGLLMECEYSL